MENPQENEARELVVSQARDLATQPAPDNPIGAILTGIIEKGVTADNVAALEKVCDLYEKMDAIGAKKAFAAAKCLLQAELPRVMATQVIPTKTGEVRSVFAPYEEIMATVEPYLAKHGFSVSFDMEANEGRMKAICTLSHSGGHAESNNFAVRVGSGPPGCSDAQSDGAARSYARRGALCDALNIVVDKDTDARLEGACISAEQARDLAKRAKEAGISEKAFLNLARATSYATIREHKLPILEQALREKAKAAPEEGQAKGGGAKGQAAPPPGGGEWQTKKAEVWAMLRALMGPDAQKMARGFTKGMADYCKVEHMAWADLDEAKDAVHLDVLSGRLKKACEKKDLDWTAHLLGGPHEAPEMPEA